MRIHGLDFTSAPGKRKPLIALGCALDTDANADASILRIEDSHEMTSFEEFEEFLGRPGPWVCGMDFPFGQPRSRPPTRSIHCCARCKPPELTRDGTRITGFRRNVMLWRVGSCEHCHTLPVSY